MPIVSILMNPLAHLDPLSAVAFVVAFAFVAAPFAVSACSARLLWLF